MFGRVGNPFLVVRVEHRGLDIRVAEHILDLVQGGAMLDRNGGGGVAKGMGGDASLDVGGPGWRIQDPRGAQIRSHHILDHADPDRPTAAGDGTIVCAGPIAPRSSRPTKERVVVMCRTVMPLRIGLMPGIMTLEIGEQGGHDPLFQDDRFAGHILAFAMNLQEMVPLVEIEVPTLGAGELDTAEADRTPEDGHRVVAEGQLLLSLGGSASGDDLEELSDLLFTEAVPNEAFGDPEAADLVHRVPGEFALVDHPATEAAKGREVKIHRPRFDGVAQIGLIDAEQGDRQGCGLAITSPPFEEPPERLAVGHDGRGCPIAGQKALHDRADVVVGSRRTDRRVFRPP